MTDRWDAKTISALSPTHVGGYLRAQGWAIAGPFGAHGLLYTKKLSGRDHELVLPTRATIADFSRRMGELVTDLAKAEDRPTAAVIFELTLTPFDVIRVRAKDADDYGSIPFTEGVELHDEAKNLLLAAARAAAAEAPKKAWKGRRPEAVSEYFRRLRLGQTEKSSFSVTVLSPYSFHPAQQGLLFRDEAFGRRVTRQFAEALSALETALSKGVSNLMPAFEATIEQGVSADLCHSLGKLADNGGGTEVSVTWSPAKPEPRSSVRLSLTRQDAAILQEVARVFAREEPEPDAELQGIVIQIGEEPNTFDGSATIEAVVDDRLRRVRIKGFQEDQRALLIEAFEQRKPIQLEGELVAEGTRLKLSNPRNLLVVRDSDDPQEADH